MNLAYNPKDINACLTDKDHRIYGHAHSLSVVEYQILSRRRCKVYYPDR